MSNPVRAALRCATNSSHMRLHAHPVFAALLEGRLSRTGYAALLFRLLGLHGPIEQALARYDHDPLMAWRRKGCRPAGSARIRKDLVFLGFDTDTIESASRAETLLPVIGNCEAALGCAWVVEGSSLGGAVLGRKVEVVLGSSGPERGGAFFASGTDHQERWNDCCAAVELCGTDQSNYRKMEIAAIATFDAFEACLRPAFGRVAEANCRNGSADASVSSGAVKVRKSTANRVGDTMV